MSEFHEEITSSTPSVPFPELTPSSLFTSTARVVAASPTREAVSSLAQVGHLTKLDPQDAWLPITESRNGNACYAAFHSLSAGIGFQALLLPLAFTPLGWVWGVVALCATFVWQMYTLWLLIQLHEALPGTRHSRYLKLSMAAFGEKLGKMLALFPTLYLAGGTCVTLIMVGGETMRIFVQTVCGSARNSTSMSIVECYIIFVCAAAVLSQLPNLNSIAGVSLIGAATAVTYCTFTWLLSISKTRPPVVSYEPLLDMTSETSKLCSVLNALGIIAFAFRGHNLVLEIQGTMPSTPRSPSRVPLWKGAKFAYLIIACSLFPMAIAVYWAYGNLIPANGCLLSALHEYHTNSTSKITLATTSMFVMINSLTSFQIYAMPVFDNLELRYTSNKNGPCPRWLRALLRLFFCCLAFFIAVALPFLKDLAGLLGGIALPITLAYPCLMWIMIKKPQKYGAMWCLNWLLGSLGMVLSVLVVLGAIWAIATQGIEIHFFKPK